MSATNRGGKRSESDNYPTPSFCVKRLLEACPLRGGLWLEPGAGEGSIIKTVAEIRDDISWVAAELRSECLHKLNEFPQVEKVVLGDFLKQTRSQLISTHRESQFDVVLGNPPYSLALPFIQKSMKLAPVVVMLLRLSFLASAFRQPFMTQNPPDIYVLPDRPSFAHGSTDSSEYAWFVFYPSLIRTSGQVRVLGLTPPNERKRGPRTKKGAR